MYVISILTVQSVEVDISIVSVKPNFLAYLVGILAKQRWEEISSISMITKAS